MSFNLDDPLAGILSDGSDDSFFDDDAIGKKKPAKKKTTPISEKKNALFDLGDGDNEKTKPTEKKKESTFDLGVSAVNKTSAPSEDTKSAKPDITKSPTPFKRTVSKESIRFAEPETKSVSDNKPYSLSKSPAKTKASTDKLDFLDDLIDTKKDTVKPLEKRKSSQSLLDDILGGPPSKSTSSNVTSRPVTAGKSQDFDLDKIIAKTDSKQTLASTKNAPQKQNSKAELAKEETKKAKPSDDWLGIFQNKDMDADEEDDPGMPAWLVGDSKKKKADTKDSKPAKQSETKETAKTPEPSQENIPRSEHPVDPMEQLRYTATVPTIPAMPVLPVMPSMATRAHGSNEDITAEGAGLFLEQQESQLMVALQLKAQEEKLAAMQTRQKETQRIQREAMQAQHSAVDAILQRQQQQRQQMQAIIASHQERITQRIKDLLGTSNLEYENQDNVNEEGYEHTESERRESPHMKEKKQLLQLVQSLQENHDKEIDLMETSYRRQLAFLEVSVQQSEERMKEESDKLVKFYTEKINWLEEHHLQHKKLTEENIASLTERHKSESEMLRQQHLENIKVLQEHHAALMENIKNAVKQEQVLIQDSAGFSSDLHTLVNDVKESKNQCQQLFEKVQVLSENTQRESERSLLARETQVSELIQQLKRERENFETEKVDSREMVKMLETRLKQMTTMVEEETASLKQKKMEFEFEKATFGKQTEFAKNVLKKQDEEMKMLRDDIQKEYQEKIAKINEEKTKAVKDSAAIAKEKASIQNLKQELEKTKAELHAQLEEVSDERSKLNLEKQQMHMEEQRILSKSRDLDLLAKTAIEKQTQADKKYAEAEFIQKKYEDRIRRLQEHVVSLTNREKQIAKEKVALSRERLNLHNEKKLMETRQHCSLCKPPQSIPAYSFEPSYTLPDTFLNVPVSRDYGGMSSNYAINTIEQEMAHFMGSNFNSKHISGTNNSNFRDDGFDHSRPPADINFHSTYSNQVEPGSLKDHMDPKFMMLRLDVQQVLSNLEQSKKDEEETVEQESEKE
ncbi:hypothetical protein NE865_10186 [Phthorimaea operculella]|nr:hypothetical protein NE865_10186 [Phthorimaea operculella]